MLIPLPMPCARNSARVLGPLGGTSNKRGPSPRGRPAGSPCLGCTPECRANGCVQQQGHIGAQKVLVWQAGGNPRACQSFARDGFLCRAPAPSAPARAGLQLDLVDKKNDMARTISRKLFVKLC